MRLATGDQLVLDGITLDVLWPDADRVPRASSDDGSEVNDASIVLLGSFQGRRFLLTGDAEADVEATLVARGLPRLDVQYHWHNPGWADFEQYLAAFDHKHRKNIRQERAQVARTGVRFRIVHGDEASEQDLAVMHAFYLQTFAEYGNQPALTLDFLRHLAKASPRSLVLFLALHEEEPIAGALCRRGGDTLYGRYWGAFEHVPGLHFETSYYQGIDYCLREGLIRFEPGAQGEHKLARGFLPTLVRSRHWIAHPQFRLALAGWCT